MSAPFVVLVEGIDDQEVVRHLLRQHGLTEIEVEKSDGSAALLASIPVRPKASDLEALAIVVDADIDINARWQSISDALRMSGYSNCPHDPHPDGMIVNVPGQPLVGVWIMPDNAANGVLEDFVAALVPDTDVLWPRAQQCVDSIPHEQRPFTPAVLAKVRMHTWLAWQEEPGKQMGAAIGRTYLDAHSSQALRFVQWIRRMIEQKPTFPARPSALG